MWKDKEVKFFSLQFLLFLSKSYRVIVWVKEKYENLRFLYDHQTISDQVRGLLAALLLLQAWFWEMGEILIFIKFKEKIDIKRSRSLLVSKRLLHFLNILPNIPYRAFLILQQHWIDGGVNIQNSHTVSQSIINQNGNVISVSLPKGILNLCFEYTLPLENER